MTNAGISNYVDLSKPFALIEKNGRVTCYQGEFHCLERLNDIHELSVRENRDVVFALPYRVIRERGFEAKGDEPIMALAVTRSYCVERAEFMALLPKVEIKLEKDISPSLSDADYAALVREFQQAEIEGGNTSQTILSRRFSGKIVGLGPEALLSIYGRLLQSRGQYMTVLFGNVDAHDPAQSQYIIAATPERHLEITGNETIMIPIAGTLRKEDRETFPQRLEEFISDPKEINELFQVVDEEMKMMGVIAPEGGEIYGPYLREIGAVIHTEYELVGKRSMNSIDALRNTLHAPTVVGSPMQSAARIISKYETVSRRYYAGEIGIYKTPRTPRHSGDLDTAILIRGAEIFGDGSFHIQAGGGLVRDSIPENEAKESYAKALGMLSVIIGSTINSEQYLTDELKAKVMPTLMARNLRLSQFWMIKQNPYANSDHDLSGYRITIVNNEDDFAYMIGHMVRLSKAEVKIVDTFDYSAGDDASDLIILGPGPGDPTDMQNPRMKKLQEIIEDIKLRHKPALGICLGHQALAFSEGLTVSRQKKSSQGMQREVKVFGDCEAVGFYNSFSPVFAKEDLRPGFLFETDDESRIIAMEKGRFIGFQFHPESVMSQNGVDLMYKALVRLHQMVPRMKAK